jgi:hypothetical protein
MSVVANSANLLSVVDDVRAATDWKVCLAVAAVAKVLVSDTLEMLLELTTVVVMEVQMGKRLDVSLMFATT